MKKCIKTVSIYIIVLLLLLTNLSIPKYDKTVIKNDKMEYLNQASLINQNNNQLLNKIQTLQDYANAYKQETGSTTSATELSLEFIRKDRYSSGFWESLLGSIDTNFVDYVTNINPTFKFTNSENIIDPITHKEIDFIHMIATLNTYYAFENKFSIINTHYAGWAGDLMTLLEEVVNYRVANNITDNNILIDYVNSLLGTNKKSTFSSKDSLADIDAYNISKISTLSTDLKTTIYNYYINTEANTNNVENRFTTAQSYLGTNEAIKNSAYQLLGNSLAQRLLINNYNSVTSNDINILSQAFADYIYKYGYIKLNQTEGTTVIGTNIKVALTEKHMSNATIETNQNIATATISNYELIIVPVNYGETEIKITSPINNVTATYKVHVKNIAPTITKDLKLENKLIVGEKQKISFSANGTNNTYTWYLSENSDEKEIKLQETTTPSIELEPTIDMNEMFLNCVVSNAGNKEVMTNSILLKVSNPKEEQDDSDKEKDENKVTMVKPNDETKENPKTSTPLDYTIGLILLISSFILITKTIKKHLTNN